GGHTQPYSCGVRNGQVDVGGADGRLRACGRRAGHPPDGQNGPIEARRTTTSEFHLSPLLVPDCTLIFYASSPVGHHGFGFAQTTMIFKCHPINEGACRRLISALWSDSGSEPRFLRSEN